MKSKVHTFTFSYFAKNISIVLGIVLIWRGLWIILDFIDKIFFNGNHLVSAFLGIAIGLAILYIPDHDLDELQKL